MRASQASPSWQALLPRNLLAYLDQHRLRIKEFPASQQDVITRIVDHFKATAGEKSPKPYDCPPPVDCKTTNQAVD